MSLKPGIVEALEALKGSLPKEAEYHLLIYLLEMAQLEALTIESKGRARSSGPPSTALTPSNGL